MNAFEKHQHGTLRRSSVIFAGIFIVCMPPCLRSQVPAVPIAYYSFDGNANDQSGNHNNATPEGNFSYVSGGLNNNTALKLIGDNSLIYAGGGYVNLPQFSAPLNNGFTISLWVKNVSIGGDPVGEEDFISFGNLDFSIHDHPLIGIGINNNFGDGNAHLEYYMETGLDAPAYDVNAYIDVIVGSLSSFESSWQNLVMVYQPGELSAYLNGSLLGTVTNPVLLFNGFPFSLAALGSHWFDAGGAQTARMSATYSDVAIFDSALTAAQVQAIYASQGSLPATLLFDTFPGTTLNTSNWIASTPVPGASVAVNDALSLTNGGAVLTQSRFPTSILVNMSFQFTGNTHDSFKLVTRTDGVVTNNSGEFDRGIRATFRMMSDTGDTTGNVELDDVDFPIGGTMLAVGTYPMNRDTTYNIDLLETDSTVSLFINGSTTPILTASTTGSYGDQIGIDNREGAAAGSSISEGDQVTIESFSVLTSAVPTPTPSPTPSPSPTRSPTPTPRPSPTPRLVPTPSATPTPTPTRAPTPTPRPSPTPSATPLPTPTRAPTPTPRPRPSLTPSPTPT